MTNFPYNENIPDGPNNPSQDQPLMQENTNSISGIIEVDHGGFGENNGGIHNKVTMPRISLPSSSSGQLILFTSAGASGSQLNMVRDGNASTNTALTPTGITAPLRATNGYSWLPGKILMQWGFSAVTNNASGTITFPIPFSGAAGMAVIVTISPWLNPVPATNPGYQVHVTGTSLTGFTYRNYSNVNPFVYWHAIGPVA